MMSTARKRTRDMDIDLDDDDQPDVFKRPRASTSDPPLASRPLAIRPSPDRDASLPAVFSDTSSTPDSMDLDAASPAKVSAAALSSSWPPPVLPPRRADSLFTRPVRPKPYPLQPHALAAAAQQDAPDPASALRLSRLSVSDMDVDDKPETELAAAPAPVAAAAAGRRGRQRSGAFVGDPSRRFQMGYREDCEKCRMRAPGHTNHLLAQ